MENNNSFFVNNQAKLIAGDNLYYTDNHNCLHHYEVLDAFEGGVSVVNLSSNKLKVEELMFEQLQAGWECSEITFNRIMGEV